MTQQRCHFLTLNNLHRIVAKLAVLSLLLAAGLDGLSHMAHAGHLNIVSTHHAAASHHHNLGHVSWSSKSETSSPASAAPNRPCNPAHQNGVTPGAPSDPGSNHHDCGQCCAAHCFACVMPTISSMMLPWLTSKKGNSLGLFAAPPPTWRLERPPKTIL